MGFFANDTSLRGLEASPGVGDPSFLMRLTDKNRSGLLHEMREVSRLADYVCDGIYRRVSLSRWAESRSTLFRDDYEGWIRVRAALRRARDDLEHRGGRFAVVLVPFLIREGDHLASTEGYRAVSAFCAGESIPCFDLEPAFAGEDVESLQTNPRDYHAGARAHRIEGEAVARWLREQGLLRTARDR